MIYKFHAPDYIPIIVLAQLLSCLDMIRDVIGDTIPDHIVTQTVIDNQFSGEKALDILLEKNSQSQCKIVI